MRWTELICIYLGFNLYRTPVLCPSASTDHSNSFTSRRPGCPLHLDSEVLVPYSTAVTSKVMRVLPSPKALEFAPKFITWIIIDKCRWSPIGLHVSGLPVCPGLDCVNLSVIGFSVHDPDGTLRSLSRWSFLSTPGIECGESARWDYILRFVAKAIYFQEHARRWRVIEHVADPQIRSLRSSFR